MKKLNIGLKEDILKLDKQIIMDYYDQNYSVNNFFLVIAGNLDEKETKSKIKKLYKDIKKKRISSRKVELLPNKELTVQSIKHLNLSQFIANIDILTSTISNKNNILDNLTAGVINEALNSIIKTKFGMVYQIRSTNFSSSLYGKISINYTSSLENGPKVIKLINDILSDIALKGNDEKIKDRIEAIKNQYVARLIFNLEKTSALADYHSYRHVHGAYIKNHIKEIETIKNISHNEVFDNLKKISKRNPKITVVTSKRIIDEKLKSLWSLS